MPEEHVEGRNVTLFPEQWETVDRFAQEHEFMTKRGPNTSLALRFIVMEWAEMKARREALAQSPTLVSALTALAEGKVLTPVPVEVE
jgi:hypothetical protein